ncbi:AAA family ATPase [Halothermothrix orenii]|uniref:Rad50/SbcC-type AAA domain-containing protein n=1 Tax=Halothermothrix orenii (strain H 168 / OCM 544 / DSM 9562) TaxID=373903 RepID=B8D2G8_HALOH|nr:AAA family ATPase [Halothermothrix orenii]ACL69395.1 hypothetical protein Hore_06380 [Halothermothrix orenii H 168]
MRIKSLYIKDFGIFREQKLEKIAPGMVVIGGPNRAGKTTFLNIIRYLWFGFPSKKTLPPALRKYEVEADIALDNEDEYNIYVEGQAPPKITAIRANSDQIKSFEELVGVDEFTYHRLFTIPLNELNKIPSGVEDEERIQSLLLGAGLKEILLIPRIKDELYKKAYNIGRKHGNPRYGQFKPYFDRIKEGIKNRQKALSQVREYEKIKDKLSKVNFEINELENSTIPDLEHRLTLLDVLHNNYQDFQQLNKLKISLNRPEIKDLLLNFPVELVERVKGLKDKYLNLKENYNNLKTEFKIETGVQDVKNNIEKLLDHDDRIKTMFQKLSGLREKVKQYKKQKENLTRNRNELFIEMEQINSAWQSFKDLKEIKTDAIEQKDLEDCLINYTELSNTRNNYLKEINELEDEKARLEEQLKSISEKHVVINLGKYFILALIITISGAGLSIINPVMGIIIGTGGVSVLALYWWYKGFLTRVSYERKEDLNQRLKDINGKLNYKNSEFNKIQDRLSSVINKFHGYSQKLGLKEESPPELVRLYFDKVQGLKKKIKGWQQRIEDNEKYARELDERLFEIIKLLTSFPDISGGEIVNYFLNLKNYDYRITYSDKLFSAVEELYEYLQLARRIKEQEEKLAGVTREIVDLIKPNNQEKLMEEITIFFKRAEDYEKYAEMRSEARLLEVKITGNLNTRRVRNSLEYAAVNNILVNIDRNYIKSNDGSGLINILDKLYRDYTSQKDIEKDFRQTETRLEKVSGKLENLKEERKLLQDKLKELSTVEKLHNAQAQIDEGRNRLQYLAEKYALYKTATYLLDQVQNRFIERARETLLSDASNLFNQITGGEYKKILPPDNLLKIDFQAVLSNGNTQKTVNVLSRGTREQLYLAIRVSRLRQIKPPLPVIIDDSLVNFDSRHLEKTIEILSDLAETHQVFILTCHHRLVDYIERKNHKTQFWKLEKGVFNPSSGAELKTVLK